MHEQVYGRLSQLATAAMLPWLIVSAVSLMLFNSPNAIVTPLIWALLLTIWSYPVVLAGGRLTAWTLRVYGQYDRANWLMSWPGSMGAFLFAMLVVPPVVIPFFADSYWGLMASCMLSVLIANLAIGRLKR